VAWTGDIVDALLSTVSAPDADWVGYATRQSVSTRDWFWHTCHNWLPAGGVYKSMRHAARYSRRLLDTIAGEMRSRHVQCDEITAPSICHLHGAWCVVDDSWQPGHPSVGSDPTTGEDLYQWNTLISPDQWDAVVRADAAAATAELAGGGAAPAAAAPAAAGSEAGGGGAGGQAAAPAGGGGLRGRAASRIGAGIAFGGRLYHKIKWL
jgi:hypothetical protein